MKETDDDIELSWDTEDEDNNRMSEAYCSFAGVELHLPLAVQRCRLGTVTRGMGRVCAHVIRSSTCSHFVLTI